MDRHGDDREHAAEVESGDTSDGRRINPGSDMSDIYRRRADIPAIGGTGSATGRPYRDTVGRLLGAIARLTV